MNQNNTIQYDSSLELKLKQVKLLLLDVDGILTDGKLTYTDTGEEIKSFSSSDGLGIRLLMDAGIQVGIITGRKSGALTCRCSNLGIDILYDGINNKVKALETILEKTGVRLEETAFAGDDLQDLGVMKKTGLSVTVPEAPMEVKELADIITDRPGGKGAVRQICEAILKAKGLWENILAGFLS